MIEVIGEQDIHKKKHLDHRKYNQPNNPALSGVGDTVSTGVALGFLAIKLTILGLAGYGGYTLVKNRKKIKKKFKR